VQLGGPSVVVGPDCEIVAESEERFLEVVLEHQKVVDARAAYPGYLETHAPIT
jgi:hypothetical protein